MRLEQSTEKIRNHFRSFPAWGWLLLIILFTCYTRMPSFHRSSWMTDESAEAIVAQDIADGKIVYQNTITHRAPLQHFLFAALFSVFGHTEMNAVHAAFIVCLILIVLLLYGIGKAGAGPPAGLIASFLFALQTANFPYYEALTFQTEYLLVLFSLGGTLLAIAALRSGRDSLFIPAGVCLGLAFFGKQTGLMDAAALLLALVVTGIRHAPLRRLLKQISLFGAGFLALTAGMLLYFYAHQALDGFFYFFWTFNTDVYIPLYTPFEHVHKLIYFLVHSSNWLRQPSILISLGYVLLCLLRPKSRGMMLDSFYRTWLSASLFLTFAGTTATGRNYYHYYVAVLPAASLITAALLQQLYKTGGKHPGWRIRILKGLLSCYFGVWMIFHAITPLHRLSLPAVTPPNQKVVDYLKSRTMPGDTIVVWGYVPEYYIWTKRSPGTRFSISNYLTGFNMGKGYDLTKGLLPDKGTPFDFWQVFFEDMRSRRPAYFVDTTSWLSWPDDDLSAEKYPPLKKFLNDHYVLEKIMERRKGKDRIRFWKLR